MITTHYYTFKHGDSFMAYGIINQDTNDSDLFILKNVFETEEEADKFILTTFFD